MRKGFLIMLLSALVGGLTAFAVVKVMQPEAVDVVNMSDSGQFRTVNLSHEN